MPRRESRRIYNRIALPGIGHVLELHRDNVDGGNHVHRVVTSNAPDAPPVHRPPAHPVHVTLTPAAHGGSSETATLGGVYSDEFILELDKGVLEFKRFVLKNGQPTLSTHYSMWDAHPLPKRDIIELNENYDQALVLTPTRDGEQLYFQCGNRDRAGVCARMRRDAFNKLDGGEKAIVRYFNRNQPYLLVTGLMNISARFYFGEIPERNPLEAVFDDNTRPTQARPMFVGRTGTEAFDAAVRFLREPIIWKTTIREAMHFVSSRYASELQEHAGGYTWRPPTAIDAA